MSIPCRSYAGLAAVVASGVVLALLCFQPVEQEGLPLDPQRSETRPTTGLVTFDPETAAQLARVLDEVWDLAPAGEVIPNVAPSRFPRDMALLDPDIRRKTFVRSLLPHLLDANRRIADARRTLLLIRHKVRQGAPLGEEDRAFLQDACARFRVDSPVTDGVLLPVLDALKDRIDEVPPDLGVAQSAVESGWGASRLARDHNNVFGQWKFPAAGSTSARSESQGPRYARFRHLGEAVEAYVQNLNTFIAYEPFRRIRGLMRGKGRPLSSSELAQGLLAYSELGQDYIVQVQDVIRRAEAGRCSHVRLGKFDSRVLAAILSREDIAVAVDASGSGPDA